MRSETRKLFYLITLSLIFALLWGNATADFRKDSDEDDVIYGSDEFDDCDSDDADRDYCPWQLSKGAIIGIVIGILVLFFGIPILLCFCCAWCCFSHRRKSPGQTINVAVPNAPYPSQQYPQQTYQIASGQPHQAFTIYPQYPNGQVSNQYPLVHSGQQPQPGGAYGSVYTNMPMPSSNTSQHIYEQPPPYNDVAQVTSK